MAKISGIDEKWHESLQILLMLKTAGPLNRKDLCEKVVENQKKIISDYTRSKSRCIYWINSHLKDGKIREVDSLLELTQLGRWIVESESNFHTFWIPAFAGMTPLPLLCHAEPCAEDVIQNLWPRPPQSDQAHNDSLMTVPE